MPPRSNVLDRALAELARVPPRRFTTTRYALAARLEEAGQPEAAATIRKRRAPTLPVWAINRLAQEEPALIRALVRVSDRMRSAQVGRRAEPQALKEATTEQRQTVTRLMTRAESLMREADVKATHQVLRRIQDTLVAAAATPAHHETLQAGRLERELQAPGFAVFGELTVVPPVRRQDAAEPAPRRRDRGRTERAARQAEARAARERARAERTEREAQERQARAARVRQLEAAAAETAQALETARAHADEATRQLRQATVASQAAARELAAARRKR
jgi:hypothetical protein